MPNIKSSTDLRNNYDELSAICHESREPIFITRNGQGDLAVMGIEAYEMLNGKIELYKLLDEGRAAVQEDRKRPIEDVMRDIREITDEKIYNNRKAVIPMSKKIINADAAPQAIGPYSHAIDTGLGLIFTSGQIPINPATGELVQGGIEAQTEQVFANLKAVLEAAGSSFDQVVKANVYLQDLKDFTTVNGIYANYLGTDSPARSAVQVAGLPKGALVEIELIALS